MTTIINHCGNMLQKWLRDLILTFLKNFPPSQIMVTGPKELPWPLLKPAYASTETIPLVFVSTETKTLYRVST